MLLWLSFSSGGGGPAATQKGRLPLLGFGCYIVPLLVLIVGR